MASELAVTSDLWLDGSTLTEGITLSGNNSSRVLNISAGTTVDLNRLTITAGMTAADSDGAGCLNAGDLTVRHSTVHGNASGRHGGGIANSGLLTVVNSTVANNTANQSGGGVDTRAGSLLAEHVTLSGNAAGAAASGGGLYAEGSSVTLRDSIVASNTANSVSDDLKLGAGASISPVGSNLFSTLDGSGLSAGAGILVGDPLLEVLGNYGGPTLTLALLPGSPAIDAATAGTSLSADQRGFERTLGAGTDLGAYETPAGDYTRAGLSLFATVDPARTGSGVNFEISTDRISWLR